MSSTDVERTTAADEHPCGCGLTHFYNIYYARLFVFALSRLNGSKSDAADVVQETLALLILESRKGSLRALNGRRLELLSRNEVLEYGPACLSWCMTAAGRLCSKQRQRIKRRREQMLHGDVDLVVDRPDAVQNHDRIEAVTFALAKLPTPFRRVIELHFFSHLSIDEVATVLNLPPGTVKSRLHTARAKLEPLLADCSDSHPLTRPI